MPDAADNRRPHSMLWYAQPAPEWKEGLPIGNGTLGGMVLGDPAADRVALNHEWLWRGEGRERDVDECSDRLEEIRRLFFEGRTLEAGELANEAFGGAGGVLAGEGRPNRVDPYQPAGDLWIRTEGGEATDYRRELDLDAARVTVRYRRDGVTHRREYIAHAALPVMAIRLSAEGGPVAVTLALARIDDPDCEIEPFADGDAFGYLGRFREGVRFCVAARVLAEAGVRTRTRHGEALADVNAPEALVLLSVGVDHDDGDPRPDCMAQLDTSAGRNWDDLLDSHVAAHQALYRRVRLELGGERDDEPTDARLAAMRDGRDDDALLATYANLGRYLLIASSRDCQVPANLQGIWNEQLDPPWQCDLHQDINIQMNYWPAEPCGLAECIEPLLAHVERFVPHGREVARKLYGCGGVFMPLQTDPWGRATPESRGWDCWIGAAAWLAQHVWQRYEFSRDADYLRSRAYPLLKEAAAFYVDYLVEDPRTGELVPVPSQSPENRFVGGTSPVSLCVAAAMDLELIRDLLTHCIAASERLECDESLRATWRDVLDRLAPLKVGRHGQLREWGEDYEEAEPGHRHISHLFGLFPGEQFTPDADAELAGAARVSLERRLAAEGGHTGWSRAWTVCCWARLREGDLARHHLERLVLDFATDSLLDLHPPQIFQIEGNLGGTAGVCEMLLQSHNGVLRILPALPEAWSEGKVEGLRARGAFEVDIHWSGARAERVRIASSAGGPVAVECPAPASVTRDGEAVRFHVGDDGLVRFDTEAGGEYVLLREATG